MSAWLQRLVVAAARAGRGRAGCWSRGAPVTAGRWRPVRPDSAVVEVRSVAFRSLCTAPAREISYEQLKDLLDSQSTTIIDVREPWEIQAYGKIPGSINIPVGEVEAAFRMAPHDFKVKYSWNIPAKSESLVFSCLAGVRSLKALDVAVSLGYSRAQHYLGGFDDFLKRETQVKKE